jgi:hypothetical protein
MPLWSDTRGGVISTELLLVTSVLTAGLVGGLSSVRDAVNAEFADVAATVRQLNQSFLVNGVASSSGGSRGGDYVDSNACLVVSELLD